MRIKHGVPEKKRVLVISPGSVPFCYFDFKIQELSLSEREKFITKVTQPIPSGKRSWDIATHLSSSFDVTLAVPSENFFFADCINTSELFFSVVSYDSNEAKGKYSIELENIISQYEIIILQSTLIGLHNVKSLSRNKILIVDGWIPLGVEQAVQIGAGKNTPEQKELLWEDFRASYFSTLARANVILFANMSQKYYYLGILNAINSVSYSSYAHSKLLKIGVSFDQRNPLKVEYSKGEKFNLLWYMNTCEWYNPYILIEAFKLLEKENITLSFIGITESTQPANEKLTNLLLQSPNIKVIPSYREAGTLWGFHLGVVLAYNHLEKQLAHRYISLELASVGIPICTNKQDNAGIILESYNLCYPVLTSTPAAFARTLCDIRDNYHAPIISSVKNYQNSVSHEKTFEPLLGYLQGESKWRLI